MLAQNTARTPETGPLACPAHGLPENTGRPITVESRFGTVEVRIEDRLALPNGLLGFSEFKEFGLVPLPGGRHPQFQVLQCLSSAELSFLVAPLNMDSDAIDPADLEEACVTLGITRENVAVLLIVTVRRDEDGAHVSVNMRAPLFVDTARRTGRQYVMPNNKYSIRHTL